MLILQLDFGDGIEFVLEICFHIGSPEVLHLDDDELVGFEHIHELHDVLLANHPPHYRCLSLQGHYFTRTKG